MFERIGKILFFFFFLAGLSGCGNLESSVFSLGSSPPTRQQISVSFPDITLQEGETAHVIMALPEAAETALTFHWNIAGTGAETAFVARSGTMVVNAGANSGHFTVSTIDDHIYTGPRNFILTLDLNSTKYSLSGTSFQFEVRDDEIPVTVAIDTPVVVFSGNVGAYAASGTCSENGEAVNLEFTDGSHNVAVGPAPLCTNGVWAISGVNLTSLNEGPLTIKANHSSSAGQGALQASGAVLKDVTPPGNPTVILDGTYFSSLTLSPTITFTSALDVDLASHEVQVVKTSDSTVVAPWAVLTSGSSITGLSLQSEQGYHVVIRSVDVHGNKSSGASSDGWIPDTTGPSAPTGLAFSYQSMKLQQTGPVTLSTLGSDLGSGVKLWQLRLLTDTNTVLEDWKDMGTDLTFKKNSWYGFTDLSLSEGANYKIEARSVDYLDNLGSVATLNFQAKVCPTYYVPVYPLENRPSGLFPQFPYPDKAFCVAKFEMKAVDTNGDLVNSGNGYTNYNAAYLPASRPDGTPWAKQITQVRALQKCTQIGQGLITNAQWQTMARHIAADASNWSSSVVGQDRLIIGNYTGTISATAVADGLAFGTQKFLAASSATVPFDDNNGLVGIPPSVDPDGRRTHHFPWGERIWDLGGNVAEVMRDIGAANNWLTNTSHEFTVNFVTPLVDIAGLVSDFSGCSFLTAGAGTQTDNQCHLGKGMLPPVSYAWDQALSRGSYANNGHDNGLFKIDGYDGTTDAITYYGFRCVIENP